MMLDTQKSAARAPADADALIDPAAIAADLNALAMTYEGRERELRTAVAQRLKATLDRRPRARRSLAAEGSPRPPLRRAAVPDAGRDH